MLPNQSKTVNLLHPSLPQVPLFLQPLGVPSFPVLQLAHPINVSFGGDFEVKNLRFVGLNIPSKDTLFCAYFWGTIKIFGP
jgi:hypothetical protein